jgi:Uma2 family endonuclease
MSLSTSAPIIYPESDGQPLADNTIQFRLIVTIQGGIDTLFIDNPNVFVAGDLFWYPVEGEPGIRQAPDVMVVRGRPRGDRRSYKQWEEENIPPQVVFEIVSKSNSKKELEGAKRQFYERYGVEEYYIFNPDKGILKGWRRDGELLEPIPTMLGWISPGLGIRFEVVAGELQLYRPDGERLASYVEIVQQRELERQRAEQERQRAEQAEQAQREAIPKLLAMSLSVEQIAEALSLPVEMVRGVAESKLE